MEDHKEKYKHQTDSVEKIKEKRGQEVVSLRKEKREKIVSSKRFRFGLERESGDDHGFTVEMVKELCGKLSQSGPERLSALKGIRQACAEGTSYIDAVFSVENSLQSVVGLLTGNDADLQLEAAWCLTNISAGTSEHALAVAKMAAPYLITYLGSSNNALQDQCAWALGNIAGDSAECRNLLHAQGIVAPIVNLLKSPVPAVVQSAAFAISNIARESPAVTRELVGAGILGILPQYMNLGKGNRDTLTEIAWTLTYLSTTGEHVPAMIENGLLTSTVDLLVKLANEGDKSYPIVTPLLRCLGNVCSGPDEYTEQALENPRLLHTLGVYLDSTVKYVVKETLWVLSNIVGEPTVAESVANGPIVEKVVAKMDAGFDVRQEALYVLNNLACHGEEACSCLLRHKVLQGFTPTLKTHDADVLNLALGFIEMMLRMCPDSVDVFDTCGGQARLEGLEYHDNPTIAGKAHELLQAYFLTDNNQEDVG
ncbi:importin subunit alpha-8-like [Mya arenaria]|uniref:importin subunit alpha-8-like n=1 Tax=Mya arenaria TaxID=6604 RepID=UPI0022DF0274|nr:importin subunit alpha-8-like [Mya arenaria]